MNADPASDSPSSAPSRVPRSSRLVAGLALSLLAVVASARSTNGAETNAPAAATAPSATAPSAVAATPAPAPTATSVPPTVEEALRRLRSALPGLPEGPTGATNLDAYLAAFAPRVLPASTNDATDLAAIVRRTVYPGGVGYLRVGTVGPGLPPSLSEALGGLRASNALAGCVLDLRFATGNDFAAAAAAAAHLVARPVTGFRLGARDLPIAPANSSNAVPVMVLINRRTRGAAECLAAAVRAGATNSLLVGSPTAGEARAYRDLDLGSGPPVRVETEAAVLGPRGELSREGLAPDLPVSVSEAEEAMYLTNEFRRLIGSRPVGRDFSVRLNEAELVRRRRLGHGRRGLDPLNNVRPIPEDVPSEGANPGPAPSGVAVQDPVLGRALDLLGGLAEQGVPGPAGDGAGDSR